jgi:hypothetical protein
MAEQQQLGAQGAQPFAALVVQLVREDELLARFHRLGVVHRHDARAGLAAQRRFDDARTALGIDTQDQIGRFVDIVAGHQTQMQRGLGEA